MANYVVVGAGASGLYTAWRLLSSGKLQSGDTVKLFEWSERVGGRILSYTFPSPVGSNGLYCEFGGMRFATDQNFPNQTVEGHVLVQRAIIELGLTDKVVPFLQSSDRMYYLRGTNVYETNITSLQGLPYNFSPEFLAFIKNNVQAPYTADNILGAIASLFAPGLGSPNADRSKWCAYYASGPVPANVGTQSFPAGTPVQEIGYWNMLYDQFGDEGFDYSADGTGYTSNVINWNAADAMQANNDYGSGTVYNRLDGGYSLLFDALASSIQMMSSQYPGSGIFLGQRLTAVSESATDNRTLCTFESVSGLGTQIEEADYVFFAMPRRSLEMVAELNPAYMLNDPRVKYYLESSIDQPAIKVVLVFDQAWWTSDACKYQPKLVPPPQDPGAPSAQWVGGATITDLPLRMVYYFANNVPGGPGTQGGPYVLLASYDDMNYTGFWRELEISGDYTEAPSLIRQPLNGPSSVPVNSALAGIIMKQLADAHGMSVADIPTPIGLYFQDWGQDPFGGGYHGWAAHYNICQAMDAIRAPYQKILGEGSRNVYVVGSCYSFDQAWVEGAFCTAESVLEEFIGLPPPPNIGAYTLVCSP